MHVINHGAKFKSRNFLGFDAVSLLCICPKEYQISTDIGVLNLLHEHNLLGDLNSVIHNTKGFAIGLLKCFWTVHISTNKFKYIFIKKDFTKCRKTISKICIHIH